MKEEVWSIRKMREQQKQSNTRNTYKHSETFELKDINSLTEKRSGSAFDTLLKRLQFFLEE